MMEKEIASCPACKYPSHAGQDCLRSVKKSSSESGWAITEEDALSPERKRPPVRPLMLIAAEAERAFPDDPERRKAFRDFLLKGAHSQETEAIDAVAHEKLKERGWKFVDIYGGTAMNVGPREHTKFLLTNKLNGCIITLIVSERPDKTRDVVMTHFPDIAKARNFKTFNEVIGADIANAPKKKIVLMVTKQHSAVIEEYKKELRARLGKDTTIDIDYYEPDFSKEDTGVMIMEVPPSNEEKLKYYTWEKEMVIEEF